MNPAVADQQEQHLDTVMKALSDRTRRAVLHRLRRGTRTVSELAEPFQMSLPAVSKHIRVLERAGLVQKRTVGRETWCELVPEPLATVDRWLAMYRLFWDGTLDALETFLAEPADEEVNAPMARDTDGQ